MAGVEIAIQWDGAGLARLNAAMAGLAEGRARKGLRRALNHTGGKLYTRVRRRISEHTRVPVRKIDEYGALRRVEATDAVLEFQVKATGKGIPLKVFNATQGPRGVRVAVWPKGRYLIPHAFIVARLGGNVFWRKSKSRLPIQKPTGPSIPKELVKKYVETEFHALVNAELPPRVEHEIRIITDGVVS